MGKSRYTRGSMALLAAAMLLFIAAGMIMSCRGGSDRTSGPVNVVPAVIESEMRGGNLGSIPEFPMSFRPSALQRPESDIFTLRRAIGTRFVELDPSTMEQCGFPPLWGERSSAVEDKAVWRVHVHVKASEGVSPPTWIMQVYDSFQLNFHHPVVMSQVGGRGTGTVTMPIPPEGSWTVRIRCDGWLGAWCDEIDSDGESGKVFDAGLMRLGQAQVKVQDERGAPVASAKVMLANTHRRTWNMSDRWLNYTDEFWTRDSIDINASSPFSGVLQQLYGKREGTTDKNGVATFAGVMTLWPHSAHADGVGYERASNMIAALEAADGLAQLTLTAPLASSIHAQYQFEGGRPIVGLPVTLSFEISDRTDMRGRNKGEAPPTRWETYRYKVKTDDEGRVAFTAPRHLVPASDVVDLDGSPVRSPEWESLTGRFCLSVSDKIRVGDKKVVVLHEHVVATNRIDLPERVELPRFMLPRPVLLCRLERGAAVQGREDFLGHLSIAKSGASEDSVPDWSNRLPLTHLFTASEPALWCSFPRNAYTLLMVQPAVMQGQDEYSFECPDWRVGATFRVKRAVEKALASNAEPKIAHPYLTIPDWVKDGDYFGIHFAMRDVPEAIAKQDPWRAQTRFGRYFHPWQDLPAFYEAWNAGNDEDGDYRHYTLGPVHTGTYAMWASDGRRVAWSDSLVITEDTREIAMPVLDTPAATLRLKFIDTRSLEERTTLLAAGDTDSHFNPTEVQTMAELGVGARYSWVTWSHVGHVDEWPMNSARIDRNGRVVLIGLIPGRPVEVILESLADHGGLGALRYPKCTFTIPAHATGTTTDWIVLDLKDGTSVKARSE